MNETNLMKMANYIENIPQKDFSMEVWRRGVNNVNVVCNSVGCAVGHCTILDVENIKKNFIDRYDIIDYLEWSSEFTGINYSSMKWAYLFVDDWMFIDNTPKGTANRIRYVVKYGFPNYIGMYEEINGLKKLNYE